MIPGEGLWQSIYTGRAGKIKGQIVDLVRQSGRETLRQLEAKTGATRYLMSVLARELVASGDVYNSGYGLFPSAQARKDWQNARKNSQGQI